tara:strand:+ start:1050 stop:1391 length:342 start_codon:yes stop_codon:yes gene_type:complete
MPLIMAKTSFTVHLDNNTAMKIVKMKAENPDFSRNALIRLAISEYKLMENRVIKDKTSEITTTKYEIESLQRHINALFKQNNPDWKRKKSLPYHFPDEYAAVANYSEFHGHGN